MDRRRFVVTAISAAAMGAALVADGCSTSGGGGSSGLLGEPESKLLPADTTELVVQYAITTIGGKRFKTRTYNGKTYGPTIFTKPGATLSVHIRNRLPANPPERVPNGPVMIPDVHSDEEAMRPIARLTRSAAQIDPMNNPHSFNTTNLHVHGIQTTPHLFYPIGTSDVEAPLVSIEPGKDFSYALPVPADHPSGLHWYHPHHHGSTDVQVAGGMAGLIVVRGPIDEVPEIAAAREVFIVAQSIGVNPGKTVKNLYELEYKAYTAPQDGGYQLDPDFVMFTVNGEGVCWYDAKKMTYEPLPTPQFEARPGEVLRLRFLNGTNHNPLPLILAGFDVWQIGFDGVNTLEPIPKDMSGAGTPLLTEQNLLTAPVRMTVPGNRIELLIRAPQQAGTYALSSLANKGVNSSPAPTIELARFVVSGTPVKMEIPKKLPVPTREYPLIGPGKPKRTFTFSVGQDTSILTGLGFFVNKTLYDHEVVPTVVKLGDEEEWRIENEGGSVHPFHIHVNSFQLIAVNDEPNDPPEIWDTFFVPPKVNGKNGSITFRIRFVQFTGKSVHHCHVLPHEDTGMMQNFTIE